MAYFKPKHEQYCVEWRQAYLSGDRRKQAYLYKKLSPVVSLIELNVRNRYYQVPTSQYQLLQEECINKVFVKLHMFDSSKGTTAYSYISAICKYFYYEVLVTPLKYENTSKNRLEYTDELDTSESLYEEHNELSPEDILHITKYFNDMLVEKQNSLEFVVSSAYTLTRKYNNLNVKKIGNLKNQILTLQSIIEYVNRYEDLNDKNVTQWVKHQLGFSPDYCYYIFTTLFKFGFGKESKKEAKCVDSKYPIMSDDYCPNDKFYYLHGKRSMIKKLHKGYEEFQFL